MDVLPQGDFFRDAVFKMEYDRIIMDDLQVIYVCVYVCLCNVNNIHI
jgi:hypothetical protein